jgi:hypothetical protein
MVSYAITDWLSASGTVGHQWVQKIANDYTHWDIGLTATYKSFTLDVRYVGNDIDKALASNWATTKNATRDTVKANLTYNFTLL